MGPNDDPEFVFTEGVAPLRCFRCEGPLVECPCLIHGPHGECDDSCFCAHLPLRVIEHPVAEIVTVAGTHALVHHECLDDPSILA